MTDNRNPKDKVFEKLDETVELLAKVKQYFNMSFDATDPEMVQVFKKTVHDAEYTKDGRKRSRPERRKHCKDVKARFLKVQKQKAAQ